MEFKEFDTGAIRYIIRYPDGYKEGERYPVLLFLHGAGTRGFTYEKVERNNFFENIEKYENFPAIVVAPICDGETWFDQFESLKKLYISMATADFADPDRVYILGLSMGGYATWQLAMSLPEYTAAIVPICGGGMYWNAARLKNVPVWAHHGALDKVVCPEESVKMVEAVKRAGGEATLTIYDGVEHASWLPVYKNYGVFEWLFSKRRYGAELKDTSYNDAERFG